MLSIINKKIRYKSFVDNINLKLKIYILIFGIFHLQLSFSQVTFDTLYTSSENGISTSIEEVNGKIVFIGLDSANGKELWVSNGTWNGTKILKDIYSGVSNSRITFSQKINGILYFGADDGVHGFELWETDGTENGTKLTYDTKQGSVGTLYSFHYKPYTEIYNNKLWSNSDKGIAGYDFMNKSFTELDFSSLGIQYPQELRVYNNKLYFTATTKDSGIRELWYTQGTLASTQKVFNFKRKGYKPTGICDFNGLQTINNKLIFAAENNNVGCEIQVSDGTENGTVLLQDINPGLASGRPGTMYSFMNNLYFLNNNGTLGNEIFISDGTSAGTKMLKDINPGPASGGSNFYIGNNGILYFLAKDTTGFCIYKTNGTEIGTVKVSNLSPILPSFFELGAWAFLNNTLFVVYSPESGINRNHQLYSIDINSGLKTKLAPNGTNNTNPCYSGSSNLLAYNNSLYFTAQYKGNKTQLWRITIGNPSAINSSVINHFKVFPNPSKGKMIISNTQSLGTIFVYNALGFIIQEVNTKNNEIEINLEKAGVYFIKSHNGKSFNSQKVIIQN